MYALLFHERNEWWVMNIYDMIISHHSTGHDQIISIILATCNLGKLVKGVFFDALVLHCQAIAFFI